MSTTANRYDWNWSEDGPLDGRYREFRRVTIRSGPSQGQTKTVQDVDVDGKGVVTVWPVSVPWSEFSRELARRGKPDFEPGERIRLVPGEKQESTSGNGYLSFKEISFEHASPPPSAQQMLAMESGADDKPEAPPDEPGFETAPKPPSIAERAREAFGDEPPDYADF